MDESEFGLLLFVLSVQRVWDHEMGDFGLGVCQSRFEEHFACCLVEHVSLNSFLYLVEAKTPLDCCRKSVPFVQLVDFAKEFFLLLSS
jgi:hypothetical protein